MTKMVLILVAASVCVRGFVSVADAAAIPSGQTYNIVSVSPGKCVGVAGIGNAAPLQQQTCAANNTAQQWILTLDSAGTAYEAITPSSGMCMNVKGYSGQSGTPIIQWPCATPATAYLNQLWAVTQVTGQSYYTLAAKNSGMCLNVESDSMQAGAPIIQWPCAPLTANAEWVLRPVQQGGGGSAQGSVPVGWPSTFVIGTAVWDDGPQFNYLRQPGEPKWGATYQYLSGGLDNGWQTWGEGFVANYIKAAQAGGFLPIFTYYMIVGSPPNPNDGQPETDLATPSTMAAYFADFTALMKQIAAATTSTVVVHVEPDMWGYLEQTNDNPSAIAASVASSGHPDVAAYPNTVAGFGKALLHLRDLYAPNVRLAANVSTWAWNTSTNPNLNVAAIAQNDANFMGGIGNWDFYFCDIAFGDAGAPRGVWWDATNASAPNFNMLMHWAAAFTSDVHKRLVLWQVPAGNTVYDTDNDTPWHYQDNRAQYFLQNYPGDGHLAALAAAGVIGILFSGGEPAPTDIYDAAGDGITNPAPINGNTSRSTVADDDGGALRTWTRAYYAKPLTLH